MFDRDLLSNLKAKLASECTPSAFALFLSVWVQPIVCLSFLHARSLLFSAITSLPPH